MSIPLIGLTGAAGSGKDTVAEHLTDKYGLRLFRFSAPLKDLVARMFGFRREKLEELEYKETPDPRWMSPRRLVGGIGGGSSYTLPEPRTPREILQIIGTEGFRAVDPDFWVKLTMIQVDREMNRPDDLYGGIVIPDVRFFNEATAIRARGGVIYRTIKYGGKGTESASHVSEKEMAAIEADGVLRAMHGEIPVLLEQADEMMKRLSA